MPGYFIPTYGVEAHLSSYEPYHNAIIEPCLGCYIIFRRNQALFPLLATGEQGARIESVAEVKNYYPVPIGSVDRD